MALRLRRQGFLSTEGISQDSSPVWDHTVIFAKLDAQFAAQEQVLTTLVHAHKSYLRYAIQEGYITSTLIGESTLPESQIFILPTDHWKSLQVIEDTSCLISGLLEDYTKAVNNSPIQQDRLLDLHHWVDALVVIHANSDLSTTVHLSTILPKLFHLIAHIRNLDTGQSSVPLSLVSSSILLLSQIPMDKSLPANRSIQEVYNVAQELILRYRPYPVTMLRPFSNYYSACRLED